MEEVSRRSFLKGSALAAAGAAGAAALAGCANNDAALSETGSTPEWMPETWDYETDVLVIGYGGAGLWAGITAFDEGAQVLYLEKSPFRGGGSSSINMGQWTAPHDADAAAQFAFEAFHGQTPMEVCQAWAEEAVQNPDYADEYGLEYTLGDSPRAEYNIFTGYEEMYVGSGDGYGAGFFEAMDQHRADRGIEVLFECHDEELIQNPDTTEIVGCYTLIGDDEAPKAVKARKGVVMTLGGFEFNDELKNEYCKCYPMSGFYGWPFNTGDGIKMVQNVGAQLWHMNNIIGSYNAYFKDFEWPYAFTVTPGANNYVMLDRLGKRWIAESTFLSPHVGWHEFEKFNDSTLADFERIPTWVIAGQEVIDAGPLGAVKGGVLNTPGGSTAIGMALEDIPSECGGFEGWSVDNQTEIEKGWIIKADTLEELCTKMAAVDNAPDAASVQATLETYNAYCDEGNDPAFDRTADTLAPVSLDGPFYAWPLYPGGCSTLGGPKKNTEANVVDCNDQPIPRLYAAGCFGNMAGHTYGISGGNNAENMVWGRIAGRNAASLEAWDAQAK